MTTTAQRLEGIGEYYFSRKLREIGEMDRSGEKVINLGIGSPDLPPHPEVLKVLQEASARSDVHAYQSYKGSPVLRRAVTDWYARWYGVSLDPEREVLPLIGSKEGIMHICMTYLDQGDLALVPNPGYPTYRSAVRLAGGDVLEYRLHEENGWYPDMDALETSVRASKEAGATVKLLFVNYPHMPTGRLPERGMMQRVVDFARRNGILVVHDNPYSFILNDEPLSLLSMDGAKETVLELNSLSKSHNMAGWRVGMLCGPAARIDEVLRFKSNMDSGMFLPVQLAAAKALSLGRDWHEDVNRTYAERRLEAGRILESLGCRIAPGQAGMFLWARIPYTHDNAYTLSDEILHRARVFITPGGIFGDAGDGYLRISLCSPVETLRAASDRIAHAIVSDVK
ncbi:MAG: aminotransferase class I/II-fold pyridoxal phosphate-dependent enzyme [Chitinophagia bacterium]|nr:aminotransferase class I/II-fold pyridoxal phosphate-dependent enzyme [Chitinophagia bacterium]